MLKALQRIKAQLPTAASLADATAALAAAKRPTAPSKPPAASAQLQSDATAASAQPAVKVAHPETDAVNVDNTTDSLLPAQTAAASAPTAAAASQAAPLQSGPVAMVEDAKPADLAAPAAPDSPQAEQQQPGEAAAGQARGKEEEQKLQFAGQGDQKAVLSSLDRCRDDIRAFHNSLVLEAFQPVKGSDTRQGQWHKLLANAQRPQVSLLTPA